MKTFLFILLSLLISYNTMAQTYKVGDKLEGLETDDKWYAVTILEAGEGKYFIHWEGYDPKHDRWIEASNLRKTGAANYSVGDKLEGQEDDDKWYAVTILKIGDDGKYFIHWEGYEAKYDRWIEASKLRQATTKNNSASNDYWAKHLEIVYLENKTGQTIKYSYMGGGSSGGGTIYNGQKDHIRLAPVGLEIYVNGKFYIKITKDDDGETIVIR